MNGIWQQLVWRRACMRIEVSIVEQQQEKKEEVYGHCWGIIVQLKLPISTLSFLCNPS